MIQGSGALAQIIASYMDRYDDTCNDHPSIIRFRYFDRLHKTLARDLYQEHEGRAYYDALMNFMMSGPVVVMVLEGDNIIQYVRAINGTTNPEKADSTTLRARFGAKGENFTGQQNAVHASDSAESAVREIGIFFPSLSIMNGSIIE